MSGGITGGMTVVVMCGKDGLKRFPSNRNLLTLLRYIERNPVRASLVARAEDWWWSSAYAGRESPRGLCLEASPVTQLHPWRNWVNEPMTDTEVQRIRPSVNLNVPFGSDVWTAVTAERLGLDASLRPIGRPQKLVDT